MLIFVFLFLCVIFFTSAQFRDLVFEASIIADYDRIHSLLQQDPEVISVGSYPIVVDRPSSSAFNRTAIMVCGSDPQTKINQKLDKSCLKIIKELHNAGATLSRLDDFGWSVVAHVASKGFQRTLRYVLENVEDKYLFLNLKDLQYQRTTLMIVSALGLSNISAELLKNYHQYLNLSAHDAFGMTALHYSTMLVLREESAYFDDFKELMRWYTNNDLNTIKDKFGRTILMHSVLHQSYNVTKLLLDLGSDPRIADNDGLTALTIPLRTDEDSYKIKELLVNASIYLIEKDHETWLAQVKL